MGFRAFSGSTRFDLDGDVVLVVGVNGQGKTSLFDAIHWAFTGEISRLNQPGSVVSLYSDSGEARVEVTVVSDDGRSLKVTRHSDGQADNLLLKEGGDVFRGKDAESALLRFLWPEGLATNDSQAALRSALERGVYLQQDVLTDFLTADTDQQRFNSISELIGTGLATELQAALERSRNAWSRVTNQRKSEVAEAEERLSRLAAHLRDLLAAEPSVTPSSDDWGAWWTHVGNLGVSDARASGVNSPDAQRAVDIAMAELRSIRLARERRVEQLRDLAEALRKLPSTTFDIDKLRNAAEATDQALKTAQQALTEAEGKAAEARRRQLETRSEWQELRVLATVALRHLGERCPICEQAYDREATSDRLNDLLRSTVGASDEQVTMPNLADMASHVEAMERAAAASTAALQGALREERIRTDGRARIRASLAEHAIDVPLESEPEMAIEIALREHMRYLQNLSVATENGEALALSLAGAGQLARRLEIEEEVRQVEENLAATRGEVESRQTTGELASSIIESLRDASSDLVARELGRLEPLLQRIYATADPHPEFRVVRLLSRMSRGRGRVFAEVEDSLHDHKSDAPSVVLSSSQMNVLAVSVFLALNLGVPTLPLRVAILDDPLQSLDDLNLLGLIDLLKRIRERRQLLLSTHDSRFASLLERKLRPVADSQRTIVVELSGWNSEGPVVTQRDVNHDPVPIRIAAA